MSVNETVNQSQSPPAGGSGDSPEKLVADHVDRLWEHITADGYDLLADVAVDTLVKNQAVPFDAYLRSVKMSWCLHRAATYYARQYSVERVSADFARGDAQFEHSLRAQAERKAEKLEADLAQSVLLVENLRLRLDEARAEGAEWCEEINKLKGSLGARREELTASFTANQELRQKLETAEAALLEQQQRNEELVTQNSQQHMKIAELEKQVQALVGQNQKIFERLDVEKDVCRKLTKRLRDQELKKQTQPEPQPEPVPDAEEKIRRLQAAINERAELGGGDQTRAELQARIRELEAIRDTQADTAATEYTPPDGYRVLQIGEVVQKDDIFLAVNGEHWPVKRIGETVVDGDVAVRRDGYPTERVGGWVGSNQRHIRLIEPDKTQELPGYTPPEGWRVVRFGEPLKGGDEYHAGLDRYIRPIEAEPQPQPVQVREGRWRTRRGDIKTIRPCEPLQGAHFVWPWTDGIMTFQDNGRHQGSQESAHDLVEYLGPIEPQVEAVTTNQGDDSGGN